jgi:hypothetical protein
MDKVVFFGCILLVCFGFFLGISTYEALGVSMGIGVALEYFASVSTIVAAGVAIYALGSWRKQIYFVERQDALRALYERVDDLGLLRIFASSVISLHVDSVVTAERYEAIDDFRANWKRNFREYDNAWCRAVMYLNGDVLNFNPNYWSDLSSLFETKLICFRCGMDFEFSDLCLVERKLEIANSADQLKQFIQTEICAV